MWLLMKHHKQQQQQQLKLMSGREHGRSLKKPKQSPLNEFPSFGCAVMWLLKMNSEMTLSPIPSIEKTNAATEKAKEGYETAKNKAAGKMSEGTGDSAAEEIKKRQGHSAEQLNWAKDKAKEGYDAAKNKAKETLESVKETVASNYEATKQKPSE
ncbi:hypothetical protein SLEP1_g23781 [Rubroshorea leprosula]|uniref:Uncharacterized protein n=1 Tax=Rubroshorea leprosula TaxID=152421 RepID=A0AAV5JJH8_9ROSI|nr:hypothetical protein SLEP1_g23781 [Rubroshorea leprosula]